jgi:glutamate 5-kinase
MKVIIKIGSHCLVKKSKITKKYILNKKVIKSVVDQIAKLKKQGYHIILISSGAVASGKMKLNWQNKMLTNTDKAILAASGQHCLLNIYDKYCSKHKMHVSQILLTKKDLEEDLYNDEIQRLLSKSNDYNIIPILNENDAIATPGLRFHDNDELTYFISKIFNPQKVIFLTSVDGILQNNKIVRSIKTQKDCDNIVFFDKTEFGTGGMQNKLNICKKMSQNGIMSHICSGKKEKCIINAIENYKQFCTTIYPNVE